MSNNDSVESRSRPQNTDEKYDDESSTSIPDCPRQPWSSNYIKWYSCGSYAHQRHQPVLSGPLYGFVCMRIHGIRPPMPPQVPQAMDRSLQATCLRACTREIEHIDVDILRERVPWAIGKQIWRTLRKDRCESSKGWKTMVNAYADLWDDTDAHAEHRPWLFKKVTLRTRHDGMGKYSFNDIRRQIHSASPRYLVSATISQAEITLGQLVSLASLPNLGALFLDDVNILERDFDYRTIRALEEKARNENGFSNLKLLMFTADFPVSAAVINRHFDSFPALQVVAVGNSVDTEAMFPDNKKGLAKLQLDTRNHPMYSSLDAYFKFSVSESIHNNMQNMLETCIQMEKLKESKPGKTVRQMSDRTPILSLVYSVNGVSTEGLANKMTWFVRPPPDETASAAVTSPTPSRRKKEPRPASQSPPRGKTQSIRKKKVQDIGAMLGHLGGMSQ